MGKYMRWTIWITLTLGAVLLVAGCGASEASNSSAGPKAQGPRIAIPEESFDFGKVPLDKVVAHTFKIKNVGSSDLVILGQPAVRAVQGC